MKMRRMLLIITLAALSVCSRRVWSQNEEGFKPIFDGKTLDGWDGNPKLWRVEDGTIVGQTTEENPTSGNTFLIWRKEEPENFELKLQYKIIGGNSGVQYRSFEFPNEKWVVGGYQADIDSGPTFSGICYGERFRGILANRGQKTVVGNDSKPQVVGTVGNSDELQAKIKKEDWNDYHIIVQGYHAIHKINGNTTCEMTDEDTNTRRTKGILALQLHAGPPMKVQFRNIRLKSLGAAEKQSSTNSNKKRVVFVSGAPSHGYGAHEHYAGCMILAEALNHSNSGVSAEVIKHGWPSDPKQLQGADCIVMYSDGGSGHMAIPHLSEVDALAKKGTGIVCIHYAVEVPKDEPGNHFLDWIGGYFEMNWSVNPHWTAKFAKLPDHPITRGVKPFEINDEWYYHMRFRPNMDGVTPILSDLPPASTLERPDGTHSGNPDVRAAVARKEAQHVAWASERKDGGRGFGFTGGHDHWNWGDPNFRKLMLNAIVWCAHVEVPSNGVEDKQPTLDDLEANQDEPKPADYNREAVRQRLKLPDAKKGASIRAPKPLFSSNLITSQTPGHAEAVDIDISNAKELYLVVTDGGNGFACDWADWMEPRLLGNSGEKRLTDLKWKSATSEWGHVNVDKNAEGRPMRVNGKSVPFGIGTHANSVIAFDLPPGISRFRASVGLDNGGSDQGGGQSSSVQFLVFAEAPKLQVASAVNSTPPSHDPANAVAGLDVAEGLEATLFASEPQVLNLTNLDIDYRGRVWVCEVMNYRSHNGKRPEGDRILILEDTDHDGVADKTTVYYQGRDVDSAMGICVLGNRVIVSASPNVLIFTDTNGDDKPDKKEIFFSNTGQPQHDHSAHSFIHGPDGKLYWNFGNTGQKVCDREGKVITDMAGNPVVDNGKPYFGGMPFRCNLDGSQFEVLAHNFRNNYEVTVDSFGTLWQSDNDDDGNRGVRINYVMEFGNFGYRDEMTGASWNTPRTNLEEEIPLRHWHLNDPGVVPNLLQTGAGSPTGITVYEGRLLPKPFWDQVIHCDAGPNVVRAYPVKSDGAGYKADIIDVLKGTRDNWFRPADVCVAPDGSLFVTDWYDPGVGGHAQGDLDRGRLFRVAPPGNKYSVPKFDFQTADGAVAALLNPNDSVRYMAWSALRGMGNQIEQPLLRVWKTSDNPRHRARALWALSKLSDKGLDFINVAARDSNPDLRATAIRAARQLDHDYFPLLAKLADDPSPVVRRECAIGLHYVKSPQSAEIWCTLAATYDGHDRWYLEALGIAADHQWDAFLEAWLKRVGDGWNTPAGRDIIWRSRAARTPELLARIILSGEISIGELPRYFRAFDFQSGPQKDAALTAIAFSKPNPDPAVARLIATESTSRVQNADFQKNPEHMAALERILNDLRGTSQFVSLVGKFNIHKRYPELLALAQKNPDDQMGVEAIRTLLLRDQLDLIVRALEANDLQIAVGTARVLGASGDGRVERLLAPIMLDQKRDLELRRQATRSVASTRNGAQYILDRARRNELDEDLVSAASFQLNAAPWPEIKSEAGKLFPVPAAKDKPLPAMADLMKMPGDVQRGAALFQKSAECSKCHVVNGQGKEVGPNLSEIGAKLSRQAFFESILYPSAGISHNYETYAVALADGNVVTGILVSNTNDEVTIKSADALVRTFKKSDIEEFKKQNVSLMPADLQKTMTTQDLVDVVEYLTTLRQARN